jgi:hypothetical protein
VIQRLVRETRAVAVRVTAGQPQDAAEKVIALEVANDMLAWGKPHNGLRLGVAVEASSRAGGVARFTFVLENVGQDGLVLNLGAMLNNGRKQYPSALRLTLIDAAKTVRSLRRTFTFVAGRVDPLIVPLPAGSRYTLRYDLADFIDDDPTRAGRPLAAGPYWVAVELVGKVVTRDQTNQDSTGLALMPCWTGTVRSGELNVELPIRPPS